MPACVIQRRRETASAAAADIAGKLDTPRKAVFAFPGADQVSRGNSTVNKQCLLADCRKQALALKTPVAGSMGEIAI